MAEPTSTTTTTTKASNRIRATRSQRQVLQAAFKLQVETVTNSQLIQTLQEQTGLPSKWISAWISRERRKVTKTAAPPVVKSENKDPQCLPSESSPPPDASEFSSLPPTKANETKKKRPRAKKLNAGALQPPPPIATVKQEQAEAYNALLTNAGYMRPSVVPLVEETQSMGVTHLDVSLPQSPTASTTTNRRALHPTGSHNIVSSVPVWSPSSPPVDTIDNSSVAAPAPRLRAAHSSTADLPPAAPSTAEPRTSREPSSHWLPIHDSGASLTPQATFEPIAAPSRPACFVPRPPVPGYGDTIVPLHNELHGTSITGPKPHYLPPPIPTMPLPNVHHPGPTFHTSEDTLDMTKAPLKYLTTIHRILEVYRGVTDKPFTLFSLDGNTTTLGHLVVDRLTDPSLADIDPFQASMGLVFLARLGLSF